MTAPGIISAARISEVWRALGGGELRHGRGRTWWRDGNGRSVSVDDQRGVWCDHRDGISRGVLDLLVACPGRDPRGCAANGRRPNRTDARQPVAGPHGHARDGVHPP